MTTPGTMILQVQHLVKQYPMLGAASLPTRLAPCGPWTA